MDDTNTDVADDTEIAQIPEDSGDFDVGTDDSAPEAGGDVYDAGNGMGVEQPVQQVADYLAPFRGLPDFRGMGDRDIAGRLYQALEREKAASAALAQYQQIIPYAQDYLANRQTYQQWRQEQLAAQQAPPPKAEEKPWWNPPEVREGYKQYLVRDENGREIISPDAPPEARHALFEAQQYKADFAKKFLDNPEQTLAPVIERVATEKAQRIVEEQFGQIAQKGYVANLEDENKDWLFDPRTGDVSNEGRAVQKYVEEAKQIGIGSPEARWAYATSMVERDLLSRVYTMMQQGQQQPQAYQPPVAPPPPQPVPQPQPRPAPVAQQAPKPAPTKAEQNMDFLRREASRNPSRGSTATSDESKPQRPRSFEQMLLEQAHADGLI
jgi:hypothetical protein